MSPYIPTFTGPDIGPMAVDAIGHAGAAAVPFAPIVLGVAAYKYLKGKKAHTHRKK